MKGSFENVNRFRTAGVLKKESWQGRQGQAGKGFRDLRR